MINTIDAYAVLKEKETKNVIKKKKQIEKQTQYKSSFRNYQLSLNTTMSLITPLKGNSSSCVS